jgi:hypothetical protein
MFVSLVTSDVTVEDALRFMQKADKKSLQTTQDSKHNIDSNHNKPDTPKRKDGISCTSINVPTPHRSFLLGFSLWSGESDTLLLQVISTMFVSLVTSDVTVEDALRFNRFAGLAYTV